MPRPPTRPANPERPSARHAPKGTVGRAGLRGARRLMTVHPFVGSASPGEDPSVPERDYPKAVAQRFYGGRPSSEPSTAQRPDSSQPL